MPDVETDEEVEPIIWSGHPSQLNNVGFWTLIGLITLILAPFTIGLSLLIGGPWIIYRYFATKNTYFRLSSERLFLETGVFNKTSEELELYRVKDSRTDRPLLNRMFGLGTVVVITNDASTPEVKLQGIENAKDFRERLRRCVETRRRETKTRDIEYN
jgi:uncharacterized membrane protein YdbT with pleckstrin-like domain